MNTPFVNFSNHPSTGWESKQTNAALELGASVVDVAFPNVSSTATKEEVLEMAKEQAAKILATGAKAAMVAGEFGLTFGVATILKAEGVLVLVATSNRVVTDLPDGKKVVSFDFVQFRELL